MLYHGRTSTENPILKYKTHGTQMHPCFQTVNKKITKGKQNKSLYEQKYIGSMKNELKS